MTFIHGRDMKRIIEAQRGGRGFLVEFRPPAGGPVKEGGQIRGKLHSGALILGLWATEERGGA